MRSRSMRRHHYERLKNTRKHYFCGLETDREKGIYARTVPRCSCWMCCNPRKAFKAVTRQERQSMLDFENQCREVNYYLKISKDRYRTE